MHLPAASTLGWLAVLVPVVGGLIVGLMARYGSERIRGHGIPEAMEAILIGQSRMSPKVALLKPISSAISIGSGCPFVAEGPIIVTGGSFGSIIAQVFHLTAAECKTLLVAGAAGGMAATFNTPMAAVLLAVELLLFEWKPRSLIPVALASAVAALLRPYLLGAGPMFPVAAHGILPAGHLIASVVVGLLAGVLALVLTAAVYAAEDTFHRLPIHWMWWPALGGVVVGVGGLIQPRALGVGYDIINDLLTGRYDRAFLGRADPRQGDYLVDRAGLGNFRRRARPPADHGRRARGDRVDGPARRRPALWPLVSMAAALGGTMRCPLTSIIFALELTQDINTLPALLIASTVAHGFTVLVMKRSILTEKVARRGYSISREYAVDRLERLSVGEIMTANVVTVPASMPIRDLMTQCFLASGDQRHQGYPVVDRAGKLIGVITRSNLLDHWTDALLGGEDAIVIGPIIAYDLIDRQVVTAYPSESCRAAAERMAEAGVKRLPVVAADDPDRLLGIVAAGDLLQARYRLLNEESKRERFYGPKRAVPDPFAG